MWEGLPAIMSNRFLIIIGWQGNEQIPDIPGKPVLAKINYCRKSLLPRKFRNRLFMWILLSYANKPSKIIVDSSIAKLTDQFPSTFVFTLFPALTSYFIVFKAFDFSIYYIHNALSWRNYFVNWLWFESSFWLQANLFPRNRPFKRKCDSIVFPCWTRFFSLIYRWVKTSP